MAGSSRTGDLAGNIQRVAAELRRIRYPMEFDAASALAGEPEAILAPLHYALLGFSRLVAHDLLGKGYQLQAKTDTRFVELVQKLLRTDFGYRPQLSPAQVLTPGAFAEHRVLLLHDTITLCKARHNALLRATAPATVRARPASAPSAPLGAASGPPPPLREDAPPGATKPVPQSRSRPPRPPVTRVERAVPLEDGALKSLAAELRQRQPPPTAPHAIGSRSFGSWFGEDDAGGGGGGDEGNAGAESVTHTALGAHAAPNGVTVPAFDDPDGARAAREALEHAAWDADDVIEEAGEEGGEGGTANGMQPGAAMTSDRGDSAAPMLAALESGWAQLRAAIASLRNHVADAAHLGGRIDATAAAAAAAQAAGAETASTVAALALQVRSLEAAAERREAAAREATARSVVLEGRTRLLEETVARLIAPRGEGGRTLGQAEAAATSAPVAAVLRPMGGAGEAPSLELTPSLGKWGEGGESPGGESNAAAGGTRAFIAAILSRHEAAKKQLESEDLRGAPPL